MASHLLHESHTALPLCWPCSVLLTVASPCQNVSYSGAFEHAFPSPGSLCGPALPSWQLGMPHTLCFHVQYLCLELWVEAGFVPDHAI